MGVLGLEIPVTVKSDKIQRVVSPDSYHGEKDLSRPFEELNPRRIHLSGEYDGMLIREPEGDGVRLEFSELDGDRHRILWRTGDADAVTIYSSDAMLVFDRNRKWRCHNGGLFGPVSLDTQTLELKNDILAGGDLFVKYRLELHTVTVEETELRVSLGVRK